MSRITWEIVNVTPAIAKVWLAQADEIYARRSKSQGVLQQWYANVMKGGGWLLNGEAIIFTASGRLANGYARLKACIESDTSFRVLVVRGVSENAARTIDTQKTRILNDTLSIMGVERAAMVKHVTRHILALMDGTWNASRMKNARDDDYLKVIEAHPEINESIEFALSIPPQMRIVQPRYLATVHFLLSRIDQDEAEDFLLYVCGDESKGGEPERALALAAQALEDRKDDKRSLFAGFFKAWNASIRGNTMHRLTFGSKEAFPVIEGWTPECNLQIAEDSDISDNYAYEKLYQDEMFQIEGWDDSEVVVEKVTMTPEMAKGYIAGNRRNRARAKKTLDRYKTDLRNGQWDFNGETIKIATNGLLLDGQHRLMACIESGVSFETIVVSNLNPKIFHTLDRGARRSPNHVLRQMGMTDSINVAACINRLWRYNNNALGEDSRATLSQLMDVLGEYGFDTFRKVPWARTLNNATGIQVSLAMLQSIIIRENDFMLHGTDELSNLFFEQVCSGAHSTDTDPTWVLRETLVARRGFDKVKEVHRDMIVTAFFIRAWNAFLLNRQLAGLRWTQKSTMPDLLAPKEYAREMRNSARVVQMAA